NENYRYYTENWGSPIIATSMVQFLNTLFLGKITSVRRMRGLIDSVIILDEIQSVPVECISLFNLGINFLTEICGCTVVLCSATQPTFDSEIKHQIRISQNSELLDDRAEYAEKFRRTKVVDALRPKGYTYDQTAEFVLHTAKESNSVLLIVNTKEASKTVYSIIKERLPDGFEAVHLSTHMCPAHRKAVLSALRERLHSGKKVICVSTQLIEAGVDISFETVIRSLAGLDSIIQSAGRCNRNGETDLGSVYVINISDENISRIKTIRIGAAITRRLMETMRKTPTLFHGDITCEAAVSKYYRDYFKEAENELDYNVSAGDLHTTMFQLLSVNTDVKKRAEAYGDRNFNQCFNQSFKTAGKAFQVIEEYANSVVVPFGEGKKLIEALCSEKLSAHTPELLRQLGHYSIGLSDRQCEGRVERNEKTGVLILKDGYYNSEYGFDPDGSFGTLLF
ncbi:MAG: CRISPR-associated helicase/endonuclease Cas3, partial [Ruminococcus sp.]|nr:CRISPR-associated helicase/endonuclease Cas3 [Ruminococcus sp.]